MYIENEWKMKTLTEILKNRHICKDKYVTLVSSKSEDKIISYSQIFYQSMKVLGCLQNSGIKKGERLIFQMESNYHFIHTMWACIFGGIIAVPVICDHKEEYKQKVFNIVDGLQGSYMIGSHKRQQELLEYLDINDGRRNYLNENYLDVENIFSHNKKGEIVEVHEDDIVFIQYSSGSTNSPKGVVLTHKNLVTNIRAIIKGLKVNNYDVMLFWIPLTHDMGLIGGYLTYSLSVNSQVIMETQTFIFNPTLYLKKISQYRATLIIMPDFGLQYVLHGIRRSSVTDYDLSSLRLIINGAEPISVKVCREFEKTMSAFGLKEKVIFPVYGMAEATLAVAFPEHNHEITVVTINRNGISVGKKVEYLKDVDSSNASSYVDEGYPVENIEFRICDNQDNQMEEDVYGNIQIKGPSVSSYYYNDQDTTKKTRTKDGWLKTGDVGFICNSKLVVIGRSKDVIIINGQYYFAIDFERTALLVKGMMSGKVAASSVYNYDKEKDMSALFVVYRKALKDFMKIAQEIKKVIMKEMGIIIDYVIPVNSIPKTSSGKVMRFKLKHDFENGVFDNLLKEMVGTLEAEVIIETAEQVEEKIIENCKQ